MKEKERAELFAGISLDRLRQARNDAAASGDLKFADDCMRAIDIRSKMQTPELEVCGELFAHVEPPSPQNGGRFITRFTGDPAACWGPFMQPGARGRFDRDVGVVEKQTVKLRAGERVQIVDQDGSVR